MNRYRLRVLFVVAALLFPSACNRTDAPTPVVDTPAPTAPTPSPTPPDSDPDQSSCRYLVTPVQIELPRDAWSDNISIDTAPGCRWTAVSTASWLRPRSGSGTGPGTLTYDADFNPETAYAVKRLGVIEIRWSAPTAGQNVRLTQSGDCSVTAAPATGGLPPGATFVGASSAGTITLTPQGGKVHLWALSEPFMGCAWTAESSDGWVNWEFPRLHQIVSGDTDVHFTVPAKASPAPRQALLTLGGRFRLTIVQ